MKDTNSVNRDRKKKYVEYGDCPKCGYFLIKHHPIARCNKNTCGFEMSWEKYRELFIIPTPKLLKY